MADDILDRFSPATREWFRSSFAEPTAAQRGAWSAISSGEHTLVVAPTGSGKTLSAFLWALDRVGTTPPADPAHRCRVLYISPMKALAVDVERNLRAPLVGIGHAAARIGVQPPQVSVSVRSGDTSPADRRAFTRSPTDVLITTPESLFLLLTSAARETLRGVETVILDEVHAVAGTKRGAHLALSLERLDALLERPATRVGLSATVRPVQEVARFLAGGRPVTVVQPPSTKEWDLQVVVPVPDLADLGSAPVDLDSPTGSPDPSRAASLWPHVEERIVDLVAQQTSTLIFANSRRLAERLTARLNEIWAERLDAAAETADGDETPAERPLRPPAQVMAQAGATTGAPPVLARAHHGSVSKEQRREIEEALKSGVLPAVVATSSLELGIDMGAVDLVVQVESPPSVASALQRVGRAGHQVGAVSRGVLFPKFRGDLVQTAVVTELMRSGSIEALAVPTNPLDVLAQHIVAMCAMEPWMVDDLVALVRRSAPYAELPQSALDAVLDMLAGRYPSDEFAELRPRIVWDRLTGTLTGRPGAQRLAVTSGGTIPDRGLFGVFLASGEGPGRRVGELDEEMVYESRVGDVFALGSTSWRIEDITHDRVLVTPAPGQPGRLPFWRGDQPGRPAELGRKLGGFVRELAALPEDERRVRVAAAGLDAWATDNLLGYLTEQREAIGHVPDDRTIVVERFRDEIGDLRIAIQSPFGSPVHTPWSLVIAARLQERLGVDVQPMASDDGIVLRLPDVDTGWDSWSTEPADALGGEASSARSAADLSALVVEAMTLDPGEVLRQVTEQVGGSALFASRFRECAARALLLPRRRPDQRQALWQQRQRAAQLLEVASAYPTFPISLEAVRECVQDVFDVPGLTALMTDIRGRAVRLVEVETRTPSPFARSLLFGYVATYLYEGDSPLAERKAAALSLDPALLAELLGGADAVSLRELLDPQVVTTTAAELQRLAPDRVARSAEDVADLLRVLGPLTTQAVVARSEPGAPVAQWLAELTRTRRIVEVVVAGRPVHAVVEDVARLRDALGVPVPVGVAPSLLEPTTAPLDGLVARFARTHTPFTLEQVATEFGLGTAVARDVLARLVRAGRIVHAELLPPTLAVEGSDREYCDADVLRRLRRRSLASLRAEVEPVPARDLARFVPSWHGIGSAGRGQAAVIRAVEQLAGAPLPASALESLVLPARVTGYQPALLDEAMARGDVLWQGHGAIGDDDGWVSLHLADTAHLTLAPPTLVADAESTALLDHLAGGGSHLFRELLAIDALGGPTGLDAQLWSLVWSGRVTGDTFAPVRGLIGRGHGAHRTRPKTAATVRYGRRHTLGVLGGPGRARPAVDARLSVPDHLAGRWSVLPEPERDPTVRMWATAELLLDRFGVLTRGSVAAAEVEGGFAAVYRILAAAEEAGTVRRGYFVEGLGASQFATSGAVDRMRAMAKEAERHDDSLPESPLARLDPKARHGAPEPLVLAATDPANVYGAALPWPEELAERGHRPGRKAGALVVIDDGRLVTYLERGGRTALTDLPDAQAAARAAQAIAGIVRSGRLASLSVQRIDGGPALDGDHPLAAALLDAGFHRTTRGLRLRR